LSRNNTELVELLDKYGAGLYTLLARLTLHQDTAEELMQELFIKLCNSKDLKKADNRQAYIYRAAINLAFDYRRHNHKQAALSLDEIAQPVSGQESALSKLVKSEQLEETLNAIGKLNKKSREIIIMRYIQEDSYETIAGHLGRTPHQVRALCHKAVEHLREILVPGRRDICERMEENVETE
jgi:RNA polymerase sigma factor (sigma-70 family)